LRQGNTKGPKHGRPFPPKTKQRHSVYLQVVLTCMRLDIVMVVLRVYCIHGRLSLVGHRPLGGGRHSNCLWGQSLRGPDLGPPHIYLGQGQIRSAGARRFCNGRQASACAGPGSQRQAGMHQWSLVPSTEQTAVPLCITHGIFARKPKGTFLSLLHFRMSLLSEWNDPGHR
jgi:hypothetical protein